MTSQIESSRLNLYTPLYKKSKFECKSSQWRLLYLSGHDLGKKMVENHTRAASKRKTLFSTLKGKEQRERERERERGGKKCGKAFVSE